MTTQITDPLTRESVESRLRLHAIPYLGTRPMGSFTPSHLRLWLRTLEDRGLSAGYRRGIFAHISTVFTAAAEDRIIRANPCAARSVRAPRLEPRKVVDFLGGVVHVVRQVELFQRHRPVFAPPKGGKERDVPLPESVAFAPAAHLRRHPATEITLPWKTLDDPPVTASLLFTGSAGLALDRNRFNDRVWRPALRAVDVETGRDNGMHALRHFLCLGAPGREGEHQSSE
jgi:hypothetical protein